MNTSCYCINVTMDGANYKSVPKEMSVDDVNELCHDLAKLLNGYESYFPLEMENGWIALISPCELENARITLIPI